MATVYTIIADAGDWFGYIGSRKIARTSDGDLWFVFPGYIASIDPAETQIYLAHSSDGGVTWVFEKVSAHIGAGVPDAPSIAVDSADAIHIVWEDFSDDIWYRIRTHAGVWGGIEQVTITGQWWFWSGDPAIAIDSSDNVHVVWGGKGPPAWQNNIIYRKKTVGGAWEGPIDISGLAGVNIQWEPSIAVDKYDIVHVAWYGTLWGAFPTKNQVVYQSCNAGVWGGIELVTDENLGHTDVNIAVEESHVHCVWMANLHLQYMERTGVGVWVDGITIDGTGYTTSDGQIAIDTSGTVHVVYMHWTNAAAPRDIKIRRRRKVGASWQIVEELVPADVNYNLYYACVVYAVWPEIAGVHPCIPVPNRIQGAFAATGLGGAIDEFRFFTTFLLTLPIITTLPATGII